MQWFLFPTFNLLLKRSNWTLELETWNLELGTATSELEKVNIFPIFSSKNTNKTRLESSLKILPLKSWLEMSLHLHLHKATASGVLRLPLWPSRFSRVCQFASLPVRICILVNLSGMKSSELNERTKNVFTLLPDQSQNLHWQANGAKSRAKQNFWAPKRKSFSSAWWKATLIKQLAKLGWWIICF